MKNKNKIMVIIFERIHDARVNLSAGMSQWKGHVFSAAISSTILAKSLNSTKKCAKSREIILILFGTTTSS